MVAGFQIKKRNSRRNDMQLHILIYQANKLQVAKVEPIMFDFSFQGCQSTDISSKLTS